MKSFDLWLEAYDECKNINNPNIFHARFLRRCGVPDCKIDVVDGVHWRFYKLFEEVALRYDDVKKIADWFVNDIIPFCKSNNTPKYFFSLLIKPKDLLEIRKMLDEETINRRSSLIVFEKMLEDRESILRRFLTTPFSVTCMHLFPNMLSRVNKHSFLCSPVVLPRKEKVDEYIECLKKGTMDFGDLFFTL